MVQKKKKLLQIQALTTKVPLFQEFDYLKLPLFLILGTSTGPVKHDGSATDRLRSAYQGENQMFAVMIPIFFAVTATTFLLRARAEARRRRSQTWDQLVARLEPGWNSVQLGRCLQTQDATPEESWERLRGARGLYVMYQNAKVMLEIADFAARNGSSIDRKMLAELRSDALQIRVSVVIALTQYAMHQVNERICSNALRAASMYKEMSARMSDVLQVNGQLAPQLLGVR